MRFHLDHSDQTTLLFLARAQLKSELLNDPIELPEIGENLLQPLPCFVTLVTDTDRLRGCIGCLETETPLYENVRHFACKAALEDTRFPPVRATELDNLRIKIAVLGPHRELDSLDSLQLGKHGLCVSHAGHRGVLLASVAVEWKWNKKEFLDHTCTKAGLDPANKNDFQIDYFEEISFEESH